MKEKLKEWGRNVTANYAHGKIKEKATEWNEREVINERKRKNK